MAFGRGLADMVSCLRAAEFLRKIRAGDAVYAL